ncbi:MAG: hypothetical protein AAF423_05070 [Pseudomonadota bacterium]
MKTVLQLLTWMVIAFWLSGNVTHAQFLSKEIPTWEGIEKTAEDIKNDEELVRKSIELAGDRRTAVQYATRLGWEQIGQGDPNHAIRRFNQAWLIDPDFPDIYWGFAIATHMRGDDLTTVERWLTTAMERIGRSARLTTDHGRILGERGMTEKAKAKFEEALAIDPTYIPAHLGMVRVAQDLGDSPLEEKHQKLHDELTGKTQ